MNRLETDLPFCSNPDCILHVHCGDPGVMGVGNWATLADGTIIGRGIYYGLYLCDPCGRAWHAVPVLLPTLEVSGTHRARRHRGMNRAR